jgi:putative transcriptional regulator
MESLAGKLLIASPRLQDPNFAQAVILIVSHDENGALGLILNRPLEVKVRDAIQEPMAEITTEATLNQGGPCPGPLMAIHQDSDKAQIEIVPGVCFTADKDDIETFLRQDDAEIRYFVGYTGWGTGQLEAEIEAGSWLQAPTDARQVFQPGPRQWQKWVTIITAELGVNPDALPDDPSLN